MTNWADFFAIQTEDDFNQQCLETYRFQLLHCQVYRDYVSLIGKEKNQVQHYSEIPFMPIEFFKTQRVLAAGMDPQIIFSSSGTTGMVTSKHLVADLSIYEQTFRRIFEDFYGPITDIAVLALLPSYLERSGSSLIYMIDDLMKQSKQAESNYFLYNHQELYNTLVQLKEKGTKTILFGVTYALLDFIEQYALEFPELIIMETGGMKGKRKEMVKEEIHQLLQDAFKVNGIHSEYGMTELLSQGYSCGQGIFHLPKWMRILIRDTNDPLSLISSNRTGGINVIDLANRYSCAFIATQDLGKVYADGSFEILGRFDQSDIRGCNLLVQ
ncbi:MAG: acyl transferase [Sphingobacterium sp.]|jgi:phenylacetate-coenzyme A ligase PaaK-like adenylate-forming protein|uniref:LuxE/PaaK family acyltransferase n=1 Tax=Sphingobacterium sp. CZ-UAM TaxID=1933868 RepID=UPI0009863ED9|nr:acyl transferase [Sphingobacterium sp. CZ-UAM]MDF2518497.1 acyl transferase [Sphingobacterium sp.]OOG18640.1 acyl transferase [Sphingobacterium sp. CZ-UAM]